jgi:hypothetical protein
MGLKIVPRDNIAFQWEKYLFFDRKTKMTKHLVLKFQNFQKTTKTEKNRHKLKTYQELKLGKN